MKKDFYRSLRVLLAAALLLSAAGCVGCNITGENNEKKAGRSDSIAIMTWNVQSLFDGTEDGIEYDEYRESAGWNREKYQGRLNVIAAALGSMSRKPDIIALQELESAQALTDLAAAFSRGSGGYNWTHFATIPGMALGVGIMSRFPFDWTKSHIVNIEDTLAPRPMLEARIKTSGALHDEPDDSSLVLFVCHWKSKLGGDDQTESTRRASARIILRRLRELAEAEPDLPVVIMGDLNENYDEYYRRSGTVISALLPDDPHAAELAGLYGFDSNLPDAGAKISALQKDFIIICKNKPPEAKYFPSGVQVLFSPWTEMQSNAGDDITAAGETADSIGSYNYKNAWETIDHFLLSPQLFSGAANGTNGETGRWIFDSCHVVNQQPFTSAKGLPAAYNPRTGAGLSDHLPLLLMLKMK